MPNRVTRVCFAFSSRPLRGGAGIADPAYNFLFLGPNGANWGHRPHLLKPPSVCAAGPWRQTAATTFVFRYQMGSFWLTRHASSNTYLVLRSPKNASPFFGLVSGA